MADMMNFGIFAGRLVKVPEVAENKSGNGKHLFLTLARDRYVKKDENGKPVYATDFVDFVAYDKMAENIAKFWNKGDFLAVNYQVQTSMREVAEGVRRKEYTFVVENFDWTIPKNKGEATPNAKGKTETVETPKNDELPF